MVYTFKLSAISAWSGVRCESIGFAAAVELINMILNTKILWFRILLSDFAQNFKKLNWGMDFGRILILCGIIWNSMEFAANGWNFDLLICVDLRGGAGLKREF